MSEGNKEKWVCPSCGFDGNDGNFCIECGFSKPVLTTPAVPKKEENEVPSATESAATVVAATPVSAPFEPSSPASQAAPVQNAPAGNSGYSYSAPAASAVPVKSQETEFAPEDKKKANLLCIISLGCMFILPVVFSVILLILSDIGIDEDVLGVITMILGLGITGSEIAALGLMIYVRIKYPKSTFGKVLMWIYIACAIMVVILTIIVMVACVYLINDCRSHGW